MKTLILSIVCAFFVLNIQAQSKTSTVKGDNFDEFWKQYKAFLCSENKSNLGDFISIPLKKTIMDEDDSETKENLTYAEVQQEFASKAVFPIFSCNSYISNLTLDKVISFEEHGMKIKYEIKKSDTPNEYILNISRMGVVGISIRYFFRKINGKYKLDEVLKAYV